MLKSAEIKMFRVVPVIDNGETFTACEPQVFKQPSVLHRWARESKADYLVINHELPDTMVAADGDAERAPYCYRAFLKARHLGLRELRKIAPLAAKFISGSERLAAVLTRSGRVVEFRKGQDKILFPEKT